MSRCRITLLCLVALIPMASFSLPVEHASVHMVNPGPRASFAFHAAMRDESCPANLSLTGNRNSRCISPTCSRTEAH